MLIMNRQAIQHFENRAIESVKNYN